MARIDELNKNLDKIMKRLGVVKKQAGPTEDERIRKKYEQLRRQQLVDSLKAHCGTDGIKSAGNGL